MNKLTSYTNRSAGSIFLLIICLLISCQKNNPSYITDWKRMNLKGKVKQINKKVYNSYQDLMQKRDGNKVIMRFDSAGLMKDHASYLPSGQVHWLKYSYMNDSVLVEEFRELQNGNEVWQGSWVYELTADGFQQKEERILVSGEVGYIRESSRSNNGKTVTMEYSQQRYPDRMPCKVIQFYNEKDWLVKEKLFVYNTKKENCEETPIVFIKKNNEKGHLIREKNLGKAGKVIAQTVYKYKYDDKGNWTERMTYINDQVTHVVFRKLTYYGE